jgi:hypothetical protein
MIRIYLAMKSNWGWVGLFLVGALVLAARGEGERADSEARRLQLEQYKSDPEHYARLRRDLQEFLALPADRQEELRRLDHDLHEGNSAASTRLRKVLDRYVDWLQRLPEADRRQIEAAPNSVERLRRVRLLREREWVNQLPRAAREELHKLPAEQQPARIAVLRRDERDRRTEWQGAIRRWDDVVRKATEANTLEQLKPVIQAYVTESLSPMLTPVERTRLRQSEGKWPEYGQVLVELADKHPIHLPGPTVGPSRPDELPADLRNALRTHLRKAPRVATHLTALEGKWPEYAINVTQYAQKANIGMPKQLGPSRLSDFSPNLRMFCEQKLFPVLTEPERAHLTALEGHWPDYPRVIRELARKHGLQVPGIGLPGPPAIWDRFRVQTSAKS